MSPFFQEQDYESLVRFLGKTEIPPKYTREYVIRLKMFHMDGNSGPLGTLGLIDLLRFCGFQPANIVIEKVEETDWDKVAIDSKVEARFGGAWQQGTYLGYGMHRLLLVRLDDDPHVKECRRDMVRVYVPELPPIGPDVPDEPLAKPATSASPSTPPPGDAAPLTAAATEWQDVSPGTKVWVELGNDMPDGEFVSLATDGRVVVRVAGEEHTVEACNVTPAA